MSQNREKKDQPIFEWLAELLNFLRSRKGASALQKNAHRVRKEGNRPVALSGAGRRGDYRQRCKIGTQLRQCLLERRVYRNIVEERLPIAEFLAQAQNRTLLARMGKVLGDMRKAERYHQKRSYTPRVLKRQASNLSENQLDNKYKVELVCINFSMCWFIKNAPWNPYPSAKT